MANHPDPAAVNAEFDRLTEGFFRAVSFEEGTTPYTKASMSSSSRLVF